MTDYYLFNERDEALVNEGIKKVQEWVEVGPLPNGHLLFYKENEVGGRTYMTDECGCGSLIWDTAITDYHTLLAAIVHEEHLRIKEFYEKKSANAS
jgi:hypothetical protein